MKRILIINGHPDPKSFCHSLSEAYAKGAHSQEADIHILKLSELAYSPNLAFGYRKRTELEPDLRYAQELIRWADHIVVTFPVWFGSYPAILKGFFDRVFLPGFGFRYHQHDPFWDKLLKGRTGRILTTMDQPPLYFRLRYGSPAIRALREMTMEFVGIKTRVSAFGRIKGASPKKMQAWLDKAERLGMVDAKRNNRKEKLQDLDLPQTVMAGGA